MVNYGNGKVYKIEPIVEHEEGDIYIGSTTKKYLSQRMDSHRSQYNGWKKENVTYKMTTSFFLFEKYGVDNCHILLLEEVDCNSKDELMAREGHYIRTLKCVNKIIPGRTAQEYYQTHKEEKLQYGKEYRATNRDTLIAKDKIYNDSHKEERKQYYLANIDKIKKYRKEYAQSNKEKIQQYRLLKTICNECNISISHKHIATHRKTKKHIANANKANVQTLQCIDCCNSP